MLHYIRLFTSTVAQGLVRHWKVRRKDQSLKALKFASDASWHDSSSNWVIIWFMWPCLIWSPSLILITQHNFTTPITQQWSFWDALKSFCVKKLKLVISLWSLQACAPQTEQECSTSGLFVLIIETFQRHVFCMVELWQKWRNKAQGIKARQLKKRINLK